MGMLVEQAKDPEQPTLTRCPICGQDNDTASRCKHVRWTFDQGDPIDFARFALETSPYVHARGGSPRDLKNDWWLAHGEWVVERVMLHFDARDGYVFGELVDLDRLARDIWLEFRPDPV